MTSKILEEIKKIEERAMIALEEAHAEKQRIIIQAKQQSVKRIADASAEIEAERQTTITSERRQIDETRKDMMARGLLEIKSQNDKSRARVSKAAQFVLSEFEKGL